MSSGPPEIVISTYKHKPLRTSRSIRIILLQPSLSFDAPLECSFIEISLDTLEDSKNSYEALSYVWGAQDGHLPLFCDNSTLLITRNCDTALRSLRSLYQPRILWVDAICIDQAKNTVSTEERNNQVKMMGDVYRKAKSVLVWLGDGDKNTGIAFKYLQRIAKYGSMRISQNQTKAKIGGALMLHYVYALSIFEEQNTCPQTGVGLSKLIVDSPWTLRTWTTQEVTFAQECYVLWGHSHRCSQMSWENYNDAGNYIRLGMASRGGGTEESIESEALSLKYQLRSNLQLGLALGPEFAFFADLGQSSTDGFLRCLNKIHMFRASKPSDIVYGMFEMLKKLDVHLPDPDYNKSVETIYEELAFAAIKKTGILPTFDFVCTNQRKQQLPSWVPDWESKPRFQPRFQSYDTSKSVDKLQLGIESPGPGLLTIMGSQKATIEAVSSYNFSAWEIHDIEKKTLTPEIEREIIDQHHAEVLLAWAAWLHLAFRVEKYPTGEDWLEAVRNTMLPKIPDMVNHGQVFYTWYAIVRDLLELCQFNLKGEESVTHLPRKIVEEYAKHIFERTSDFVEQAKKAYLRSQPEDETILWPEFAHQGATQLSRLDTYIVSQNTDRSLFITTDGYLGTTFHKVKAGDQIVVFGRTMEPIVVRKAEEFWKVIGPARIHRFDINLTPVQELESFTFI
ncbi:heterokaryon incompatibility protein-domain-containing protein [Tricladium varicosporioides]|nr:heterokaryon incompatibility protein-domain-containing protein [Hymenoscyphus varicosporioides]